MLRHAETVQVAVGFASPLLQKLYFIFFSKLTTVSSEQIFQFLSGKSNQHDAFPGNEV